jgi:cytochrome oxidase Cu insertion factor (SCO1/SenC/PrrC family)
MFAGALLGPVAFGILTYGSDHREIFRPEYEAGARTDGQAAPEGKLEIVPKHRLGGPFSMFNAATRREVNDRDVFTGKWTLLYFGFTKCAEICPNTMKFLVSVMDDCEKKHATTAGHKTEAKPLQTVFVTIDTVRDGAPELLTFLERFRKDRRGLVGLYGDEDQTTQMCRAWRVYCSSLSETPEEEAARKARGHSTLNDAIKADDSYQFDHSAAAYLVGPDGKLRDFFFREMGEDHAVEKIGLHWADAYGFGADASEPQQTDLPRPTAF